ncbi:Dimerisation domain-containing protein [Streptomyces zhaozhouensis]|uniref:Dimerisation domain-containing protein n=1 Tax=Streptomyces zhaozhouensis TaxID=1300267 RepID=A0A286DYV1_9ACTN|nr:methyltransferase [Streptomyces zhaozhouensis]SOD63848.1 Dimerisation domain-containing protein [Streptomyces zhaozhouensis]
MFSHLFGTFTAQCLGAAVRLGILDAIGDGQATAEQVATAAGTDPRATRRLLRALAAMRVLVEATPGVFQLQAGGHMLREGQFGGFNKLVRSFTEPHMVRAWENLADAVRTGEPTFPQHFGTGFYDYLDEHPELSADFNASMHEASSMTAQLLPHQFDFGRFGTVVDVGGGDGTLLSAIMAQYPSVRGVVYDTASGLSEAEETMRRAGVADRFTAEAGDFFASVPAHGDVYILKSVLHNWNDEQCLRILRNVREALKEDGVLLIMDAVFPEQAQPEAIGNYLTDLNMLVNLGGQERTAEEFRALCAQAGLTAPIVQPLPVPGDYCLIRTGPAFS